MRKLQNNMPKISVIMPVYNEKESFLKKSIESILDQTFSDFEFLIVNDYCNKEVSGILQEFSRRDSRISIIKNEKRLEMTKSLNIAIRKARGEFIARMDSDDISLPDRLESQLKYLQKNNLDLIGAYCDVIDEEGNILREKAVSLPKNLKKTLMKGNFFTHSTFFGKIKVFQELYNERFVRSQDYEFLLRILGKAYKIGNMDKKILKYRVHKGGFSIKNPRQQEWSALKARVLAITKYGYNLLYFPYILRSFFVFLLPYRLKRFIINKSNR